MVQWLRLHSPSAGGLGSTLVRELAPMDHNESLPAATKDLHAATKTQRSQINKNKIKCRGYMSTLVSQFIPSPLAPW